MKKRKILRRAIAFLCLWTLCFSEFAGSVEAYTEVETADMTDEDEEEVSEVSMSDDLSSDSTDDSSEDSSENSSEDSGNETSGDSSDDSSDDTSSDSSDEITEEETVSLATPTIQSVEASAYNSLVVTWTEVTGADGYEVYRGTSKGSYTLIQTVTGSTEITWTDTTVATGTTYYYVIRAYVVVDGVTVYSSDSDSMTGKTSLSAPTLSSVASESYKSIKVTWSKVSGAEGYEVYRKVSGGEWSKIKTITDGSTVTYTDTSAATGTKYYYKVRAYLTVDGSKVYSSYSSTSSSVKTSLSAPTLKSAAAQSYKSIKVTWSKVSGASGYEVYRKVSGGEWSKIKTITDGSTVTYTDTSAATGTKYYYKVRAYRTVDSKKVYSSYSSTSSSVKTSLSAPTLKSATAQSYKSIKVTWSKVSGANGYKVYRKTSGGEWKCIKTITSSSTVSYTDTTAATGTKYYYKVRAYRTVDSKKVYSSYSSTSSAVKTTLSKTTIKSAKATTATSIKVTWSKVSGANGYVIYRKTSGGSWKKVKTITSGSTTSYTDKSLSTGTTYYYKIRAYRTVSSKKVYSSYSSSVKCKMSVPAPTLKSISMSGMSVKVKWSSVSGATGYKVYRKTSKNGEWTYVKTVSGTSYTDTSVKYGKTYYYTVKAYKKSGSTTYNSSYDSSGLSITAKIEAPTLVSAIPTGEEENAIEVTWEAVDDAEGYYIYRKTSSGWKQCGIVKSGATESYVVSGLTYGKTYTFTVKAYTTSGGTRQPGYYDKTGISAKLYWKSKYVDGYKLYYDAEGNLITNVDQIIGTRSSYVIKVNKQCNVVTVYAKDGSKGYTIPVKSMICSCGSPTPLGTYYTPAKYRWKALYGSVYGQWSTRIYSGYLFHTVYYYTNGDNTTLCVSAYNKLGNLDSMGCTRLTCEDAKWIYDNCKLKTKVIIYKSSDPGPFGKPTAYKLESWHTWDPTDPNARYLCEKYNCH